jgi:L-ascorbate metabolism protein UlaG (beta-lactamase superfamily)
MELTKYTHACVSLGKDDARIVMDPGSFTANAAEAIEAADAVLVTHEHFDHFDENAIAQALEARPELRVFGPASVVDRWSARRGQVRPVAAGQTFEVAGFEISVFGELHASIHRDIPRVTNVGYLVDGRLYHPGDAYHVPEHPVETLLLPTSGPWTQVAAAGDYLQAVASKRVIQIHEVMLSGIGQQSMTRFLGPEMLGQVPLEIVPIGDTITV